FADDAAPALLAEVLLGTSVASVEVADPAREDADGHGNRESKSLSQHRNGMAKRRHRGTGTIADPS
ncbi:MAG: hypothetical protein ACF8TS_16080, partial [Maioricimonas sp. JB049]